MSYEEILKNCIEQFLYGDNTTIEDQEADHIKITTGLKWLQTATNRYRWKSGMSTGARKLLKKRDIT